MPLYSNVLGMSAPKREKRASPRFDTLKIYQPVFVALVTLVEAVGLGLTCRHDLPLQACTSDQDLRIASQETAIVRQAPENFDKSSYWAAISSCKHCMIVMFLRCGRAPAYAFVCFSLSLSLSVPRVGCCRRAALREINLHRRIVKALQDCAAGTHGARGGYNFNWFNGRRGRRG